MIKTVLIADDNSKIREKIRGLFEEEEAWNVAEAADGREAVEKTAKLRPDLVVLDFSMPVMNGLEAGAAIKLMRPRLPLILFTAHKDAFLEKEAVHRGFSLVVSKSETGSLLLHSAHDLMEASLKNSAGEKTAGSQPSTSERTGLFSAGRNGNRAEWRKPLDFQATIYSDRYGSIAAQITEYGEAGFAAILPIEVPVGEIVSVELEFPAGVKKGLAVIRNRNVFRHGFEFLGTALPDEPGESLHDS